MKNGTIAGKIKQIVDSVKPEHAWFNERSGKRGGVLVVNVDSPSGIPCRTEPWFLSLSAEVEFRIAMTPEDLGRTDLTALGKQEA